MSVLVEFFGIPRIRCGQASFQLETREPIHLGTALKIVGQRFPDFAAECLDEKGLRAGYVANIAGDRFINDPQTPIDDGVSLLIMSSDAGG